VIAVDPVAVMPAAARNLQIAAKEENPWFDPTQFCRDSEVMPFAYLDASAECFVQNCFEHL